MRILASVLMLIGGGLLLIPSPGGDKDVAVVTLLQQAHEADRVSKVQILRQLSAMTGSTVEERSKAWEQSDKAEFGKNFSAVGDAVSDAIMNGTEGKLAEAWDR
jgi:hypothetical protein